MPTVDLVSEDEQRLRAPPGGVRIRMYRHGLGDCFLLAFGATHGECKYILIDCGLAIGTEDIKARSLGRLKNIHRATGGHLDVVVLTHEHYDHLSGFALGGRAFWDAFTVDCLWLAWTEDPEDALAVRLREGRTRLREGLRDLVQNVQTMNGTPSGLMQLVPRVLEFCADEPRRGALRLGDVIPQMCNHAKSVRFLRPGQTVALEGLTGFRACVLGPPRDEKLLNRSNPGKGSSEVYLDETSALLSAALIKASGTTAKSQHTKELFEKSSPFERQWQLSPKDARRHPFFRKYYFETNKHQWRQLEQEWLDAAGQLALRLDSNTNNTSLALALELSPNGQVLLFPGDAQVGNWLSWFTPGLGWSDGAAGDDHEVAGKDHKVNAEDLLRRTVLYKVAHHGSHNTTLRSLGLELMTSRKLIAMLPVDEAFAKQRSWTMPHENLFERLQTKTAGRILRADTGLPRERPANLTDGQWRAFQKSVEQTEEYVQLTIQTEGN